MRTIRLVTITIIIVLVSCSCILQQANGQSQLPDYDRTVGYARNLIDSYNALVEFKYGHRADFANIKANFSLYHDVGNTFAVTVVASQPNDSEYIAMLFTPIGGNIPNVTLDHTDTIASLTLVGLGGEYNMVENVLVTLDNTNREVVLALSLRSSDISGDYLTNSKNAADVVFQHDEEGIPSATQTTIGTQSGTGSGWMGWIGSVSIITALKWVVAALVAYFGGIRFVVQLRDEKERKKVVREIRQLFLRRDKKVNNVEKKNAKAQKSEDKRRDEKVEEGKNERRKTQKSD